MFLIPLPYLDPGSGSFIFQMIVAASLGLLVALRASWGTIKKRFGKKSETDEEDDDESPE